MSDHLKSRSRLVALAVAVMVATAGVSGCGEDEPETTYTPPAGPASTPDSGGGVGQTLVCGVGANAAVELAKGLVRGNSRTRIINVIGTPALTAGCDVAIDALVNQPHTPVTLEVETDQGVTTTTTTGAELSQTPSADTAQQAPPSCLNWVSMEFVLMCMEGELPPISSG